MLYFESPALVLFCIPVYAFLPLYFILTIAVWFGEGVAKDNFSSFFSHWFFSPVFLLSPHFSFFLNSRVSSLQLVSPSCLPFAFFFFIYGQKVKTWLHGRHLGNSALHLFAKPLNLPFLSCLLSSSSGSYQDTDWRRYWNPTWDRGGFGILSRYWVASLLKSNVSPGLVWGLTKFQNLV